MDIAIESLLAGARRASGSVVVIDVFRAFTTAAVALAGGAEKIIVVGEVEQALDLRASGVGDLCMGEVGGIAPPGFDFGNSPWQLSQANVAGATIIQRTSAGTQGIVAANGTDRLFAGSLVTATATARAIARDTPDRVTLVAMGLHAVTRSDEDELCAIHLRNLLRGRPGDPAAVRGVILAGPQIPDFHDPEKPHLHPMDLEIALDVDRYDFAVAVRVEGGLLTARRSDA